MSILGWRVHFTQRGLTRPLTTSPVLEALPDLDAWLDEQQVLDGETFLLDPCGRYDVELNRFFTGPLALKARDTQAAVARDVKNFFNFLWFARGEVGEKGWRDATPDDRIAYEKWRRKDPMGPRVQDASWDREVASANSFYQWAVGCGAVATNPIRYRWIREHRSGAGAGRWRSVPAETSHSRRRHIGWLPPKTYRRWRDIGLRGFDASGLPDPAFRGRFGARNATYADLMFRTGLRLREQTSLTLFDLPTCDGSLANYRMPLPNAIAKNGSGRMIYIPASVLAGCWDYIELERAEAVEQAQARGAYQALARPLVVEDPRRPVIVIRGARVAVDKLEPEERRRLLVRSADGQLEPAALWLNEHGSPMTPAGWKKVFQDANTRCLRHGAGLRCHPHLLRHSFAVITLEQLWRGHLDNLAEMNPKQRETYQMIFGDPLNWVRIRLGHRSVVTTQLYLHTLQELEMTTRMELVPSAPEWEPSGWCPDGWREAEAT